MSLAELDTIITQLNSQPAPSFAPARLAFVKSLAQRAQGEHQANAVLVAKALSHAQQYQHDLNAKTKQDKKAKAKTKKITSNNLAKLSSLTQSINTQAVAKPSNTPKSVDDILQQQETEARKVFEPNGRKKDHYQELQSMKEFRESMKHFNIDAIIARAINDGPESPGPLNPQMLAIKSLTHMRDLSPSYLRRFASYTETLLWLEKAGSKLKKRKK